MHIYNFREENKIISWSEWMVGYKDESMSIDPKAIWPCIWHSSKEPSLFTNSFTVFKKPINTPHTHTTYIPAMMTAISIRIQFRSWNP